MTKKTSLNTIIIEVISIIVAVIMGFVVNEWRESYNNKSKAELALQRIITEMEHNFTQLQEKQNYYYQMIDVFDSLRSVNKDVELESTESIPGWKGINPPLMSFSSYETASTIGVFSFIDFNTADKISRVYLLQNELQNLGTTSINSLISGDLKNDASVKLLFVIYTELIKGWISAYNRAVDTTTEK